MSGVEAAAASHGTSGPRLCAGQGTGGCSKAILLGAVMVRTRDRADTSHPFSIRRSGLVSSPSGREQFFRPSSADQAFAEAGRGQGLSWGHSDPKAPLSLAL